MCQTIFTAASFQIIGISDVGATQEPTMKDFRLPACDDHHNMLSIKAGWPGQIHFITLMQA